MSYFDKYKELNDELDKVRKLLLEQSKTRDKKIEESIKELLENQGKMLRPAFVIISASFGKYDSEKIVTLASVMELLHMASLVHDDIVDDSKLRRNKETVQSKYGKDYAVYIGDFLLTRCFSLIAKSKNYKMVDINTNVISNVLLSELEQLNSRYSTEISVLSYLRRIKGKTAELFIASMIAGASQSKQNQKRINLFSRIGYNIGMSFQIRDDILDFIGSDETIGKSANNDIKLGLYTLPVILALRNEAKLGSDKLKKLLDSDDITKESLKEIRKLIIEYKGIEESVALSSKFAEKSRRQIKKLPDNRYKEILRSIVEDLEIRNYWLLMKTKK